MGFFRRLFSRQDDVEPSQQQPASMLELRHGDPCWCGSGKQYQRCHRKEDRQRLLATLGDKRQAALRKVFI